MTRPARLGHDLDAVPVANATERTAPTWEARALAAEARLAAVMALCAAGDEAAANATRGYPEGQADPGPPPAWVWADDVRRAIAGARP